MRSNTFFLEPWKYINKGLMCIKKDFGFVFQLNYQFIYIFFIQQNGRQLNLYFISTASEIIFLCDEIHFY